MKGGLEASIHLTAVLISIIVALQHLLLLKVKLSDMINVSIVGDRGSQLFSPSSMVCLPPILKPFLVLLRIWQLIPQLLQRFVEASIQQYS